MKKTTLFTALTCCIVYTQAQTNVWDGSTTSTITTGGRLAVGTNSFESGYLATFKTTTSTSPNGLSLRIQTANSNNQSGLLVASSFANTDGTFGSGIKTGISNSVVIGTNTDAFGINNVLYSSAGTGKRFGITSTVIGAPNLVGTRCAIYGNINDGSILAIGTKPNDHRAAFFVGSTEIISSSNTEKAFIINRRDIGVAGTGTDVFRIYGDGRVFATEINVKLATSFPDYVFSPGYQLMPLREVGHFIRLNGHLPNVPTAETVEKEGMNVGEMNRVLVEKIEELTLYLLQQQAEIDSLKQEMIILKQQ